MTMGLSERNRELEKLFKEIGDRIESQVKLAAKAKLKDYYESEFRSAIHECYVACSKNDTLMMEVYSQRASDMSEVLKALNEHY